MEKVLNTVRTVAIICVALAGIFYMLTEANHTRLVDGAIVKDAQAAMQQMDGQKKIVNAIIADLKNLKDPDVEGVLNKYLKAEGK